MIIKFSEEVRLFQNETKVPKLTLRIGSRRGIWLPELDILAETYSGRTKLCFVLNTGKQIYSLWTYVIGLN